MSRELDAKVAEKVKKSLREKARYWANREAVLTRQKARAKAKRKEIAETERRYLATDAGKKAAYRKTRAWAGRNPEKRRAHEIVKAAVKSGKLLVDSCEDCDIEIVQAHHEDYSKPLEVTWLCRTCHRNRHAN